MDGWLTSEKEGWTLRFHLDEKSWLRDPWMFIDKGREIGIGDPPLLKSRQHVRKVEARKLRRFLVQQGWVKTTPAWGQRLSLNSRQAGR